jgi:CheY-like chemotaxis protein
VPAAALTAYTQPADRDRALGAGYSAFLAKPVDPRELAAPQRDRYGPRPASRATAAASSRGSTGLARNAE